MSELMIRTSVVLDDMVDRMVTRMRREEGQTAAEYLGIIVVVVAIIGVLATTEIGTKIKEAILDQIGKITK